MTPANFASILRIFLTPIAMVFIFLPYDYSPYIVSLTIILAIISDVLDGYLSRKQNTTSTFGVFLDLTTDKIFAIAILIALTTIGRVSIWITGIFVFREFFVMGIRAYAASTGAVISAQAWGKLKTATLLPALIGVALNIPLFDWVLILSTLFALISCADYTNSLINHLKSKPKTNPT